MSIKQNQCVSKIRLIEEPLSEELLLSELESALGGWNCGTYNENSDTCIEHTDSNTCLKDSEATNYCGNYTIKTPPVVNPDTP